MGCESGGSAAPHGLITYVAETGSTNADLSARISASERVAEGDWLVADRQTSGRGRQGRIWSDGQGNFMGSTIVQLAASDPEPSSLALLAGLALYETILPLIAEPHALKLKWPNDLLLRDAKLAGILLERVKDSVIVGIGVNLAQAPEIPGRKTIALSDLAPAPSRDDFAGKLATQFSLELQRWRDFGLPPVLRRWQAAAHPIGTGLTVHESDGTIISGTCDGLGETGFLRLRLADGTVRAIHAGDVFVGEG